ncbi:MAG: BMP family protein [Aulosira sp. ZfuVER01]|nr:BMP family protein [Aulosira sp. ZfuVER01]MDZ7997060.1 BMP family protein [Aulosira sp. DedVER01a]MDZ8053089.1 BMP family protein [Aulosira sp. ZfuCHP01]
MRSLAAISGSIRLPHIIFTGVFFSLLLISCSPLNSNTKPESHNAAPGAFKVAMILPGQINDQSWNQSGYEGLKLIQKRLGAQIAYTTSVTRTNAETILRQYAQQDFDFIIIHGGQYLNSSAIVAKEFPRVKFAVVTSYGGNNKNFGALAFRSNEVGYLAGVIAALKTKTNKISFIGGEPQLITQEEAILLKRAALKTKNNLNVSIKWVNSWQDPDKAKSIAATEIANGADVVVTDADLGNFGVLQAVSGNKSISAITWMYAIAGVQQKYQLAANNIVTRVVQQVPQLLLEGATLAQQGRWEGKQYKFGILEGVQDLKSFNSSLTSPQAELVESIKQDILTGKIDISP